MNLATYETLAEAYEASLANLLTHGEGVAPVLDAQSVGSRFGRAHRSTKELRPFGFRVLNPHNCLLRCRVRQPDLAFVFGQWLWLMRGADDVESIAFYNPKGRNFSDDGKRLYGAVGNRLRMRWGDQLEAAVDLLRRDPTTRRALLVIADPSDVSRQTRDDPCVVAIHLFLRGGYLEAMTTMRSQSALMVLPYDAALLMLVQTWVAAELDVKPGAHTWFAHSFHIYDDEVELADESIDEEGHERVSFVGRRNCPNVQGGLSAPRKASHQ